MYWQSTLDATGLYVDNSTRSNLAILGTPNLVSSQVRGNEEKHQERHLAKANVFFINVDGKNSYAVSVEALITNDSL